MSRTVPWHTAGEAQYHNNTDCRVAANAPPAERREGSGGKRTCPECERHNRSQRATLHSDVTRRSGVLRRQQP